MCQRSRLFKRNFRLISPTRISGRTLTTNPLRRVHGFSRRSLIRWRRRSMSVRKRWPRRPNMIGIWWTLTQVMRHGFPVRWRLILWFRYFIWRRSERSIRLRLVGFLVGLLRGHVHRRIVWLRLVILRWVVVRWDGWVIGYKRIGLWRLL